MQGLDFPGVGGMLLLILPGFSVVCVLLTAPVARAIGRRQHEEEQVLRAPLLVAAVAVLAGAVLASAVLRQLGPGEMPLPVGPLYFELTAYSLSSVLCLSLVVLVLLGATELSQGRAGVLSTQELAAVLFAWGAQCFLALSGGLPTALMGVSLTVASISLFLLLEAFRHPRRGKLWLIGWAVAITVGAFVLLLPFHGMALGSDMLDARAFLRSGGSRVAEAALFRLWLAGGLAGLAGLVAFASTPRVPVSLSPGPLVLAGSALVGVLPALHRITQGVMPPGSLADSPLGSHLRLTWMALGVVALVVALARLNAYRRLCLLCAGCVCGLAWVLSFALLPRPSLTLAGAIGVALALPVCFGAVLALEAARVSPSSAPRRLPFVALVLLPVASVLIGPWAAVVGSQLALGAQFAEAGGKDDRALDLVLGALPHQAEHRLGRGEEDSDVQLVGNGADAGEGLESQDLLALGIDRV